MGYIVYNKNSGRAQRYYKLERIAKAQATRMNNDPWASHGRNEAPYAYISYSGYEGVLMGLRAENLKYWDWMNSAGG
jgi:hypothetical protein